MLKNYITISFRQLLKNRVFSFINISGLTLGFLCFILLALYIHDELSFDMFHRDADRMYRVLQHEKQEDGTIRDVATVAGLIGKESAAQFAEVEDMCRLSAFGRITVGNDPANRDYEQLLYPDANFFSFFDFQLLEGDPVEALTKPETVVLTETMAKKYFGNERAFGQRLWTSLSRDGKPVEFLVTGIMKDPPKNSHLQFDMLFSEATAATLFRGYNDFVSTDWTSNYYLTYIKLSPDANQTVMPGKMTQLVKDHFPKDREFKSEFSLQPLSKIHLYSDGIQGAEANNNGLNPFYLYMFGAVGFLLLLIACLNYMNLSTAAAFKRTREIGTRKTLGAQRGQLVGQFISDSLILSGISLVIAVVLAELSLPFVNLFTGKELVLLNLPVPWMLGIVGLILLAGLLSALYPAFVSVRISAAQALKKEIKIGNQSFPVRKVLLTAQFTISIMMIASTLIIYRQLQYMREKDLGFDVEGQLVIDINSGNMRRNFETVKAEFAAAAEVQSISASTRVPGEWKSFPIASVNKSSETSKSTEMIFVGIDKDFLKTYNIKLLEGRTIDDPKSDSLKIVLTQLAVQQLGLTSPLGQMIEIPNVRYGGSVVNLSAPFRVEVIGVVEDFHFESLRNEMMPLIFGAPNTTIQVIDYYTLKIKTSNWPETINKLKAISAKVDQNNPMEYTFLDNRFKEFYEADAKRGQIFLAFSLVIVLIACMGLYALVSYSVESRTKEIGVRKVLGASVSSIVGLVSKEFLILVGLACVVAIPVSFFFMQEWLKDFAYRISMGAGSFILAGLLATIIAFVTISLRTMKAARENPVRSLRSE